MATATPKRFAMQQCFEILLQKITDNSILAYLTDCKTSALDNTVELVYPTGGAGNVYVGGAFAHSRRASFNVSLATWNTEVMAIQNGTTIFAGTSNINYYDVLEPGAGGAYATKFTATGTAGSEIGFVYPILSDGTYGEPYTQVTASPTAQQFSYDSETKALTFAESSTPTGNLACSYTFASADTAQKLTVASDAIPEMCLVSAYGIARDVCTGELFPCVIEGTAQIDGNWTFDLSADGDPAVQSLNMEFIKSCTSNTLYTFTVFTEEENA